MQGEPVENLQLQKIIHICKTLKEYCPQAHTIPLTYNN